MNRRLLIVVALAVAGCGAAYAFLSGGPSARPAPAAVETQPKVDLDQVLVAGQDLPMGSVVAEAALVWQDWPKAAVSPWMIARSGDANAIEEMKGKMTRAAFLHGEPMRRDKLIKAGAGGFMAAILPSGKRAVTIKIDNNGDTSAGGFIHAQDRVDVVQLARDDEATRARGVEVLTAETILANVRVLAIGTNDEEENGKKVVTGVNATLELDPDQVNLIVLAQRAGGGNLHLVLRSLADSGGPAETRTQGEGPRDVTVIRFGAAQQAIP